MIRYQTETNGNYSISYQELREEYNRFKTMPDLEFFDKKNLPAVLHFAVVCCWFKELSTQHTCADDGIIHELAHALHIGMDDPCMHDAPERIRKMFNEQLELA